MKKLLFLFVFLYCGFSFSQVEKDTVYIYFDSLQNNMKIYKSKVRVYDEDKNIVEALAISYFIEEKVKPNPEMYATGYWLTHYIRTRREIEIFGGPKNPITLIKELDFLNKIKPLDHHFFENTDYLKVCKTFEAEDSWEQDVVIFIIDKDEIKDGKIVLREVTFSRPVKE